MGVDVIFSFDSEDYETPAADEGEHWWAQALSRYSLTGSFCMVGELARALEARGRQDVLAALARHEISFHSDMHSAHPVHAEYLEGMGWDEGVAAVLAREARGVADVRRLTGQQPASYCKPGSSWGPQVLAAMALLDIPVFCDAPVEWAPGQPLVYCGQLCIKYHTSFDRYFTTPDRRQHMRKDFLTLLEARRKDGGVLVMYTHPCRLITAAFPANFTAGANPPRSAWHPAPLRPRSEIQGLMADFDDFLGWVARETDAHAITYRTLEQHYRTKQRILARPDLQELATTAPGSLEPRRLNGQWLSPAEQLGVLLFATAWQREHGTLPAMTPIRPLLGPESLAPTAHGKVSASALSDVAVVLNREVSQLQRIPAVARVGEQVLGPGALLRGLAQVVAGEKDQVAVNAGDELPALVRRADFAGLHFHNTWSIFSPEFEAPQLLQMARLQTWSARPAG